MNKNTDFLLLKSCIYQQSHATHRAKYIKTRQQSNQRWHSNEWKTTKSGQILQCSDNFQILTSTILFLYMVTFRAWIYGKNVIISTSKPITNLSVAFISYIPQQMDDTKNSLLLHKCKIKHVDSPPFHEISPILTQPHMREGQNVFHIMVMSTFTLTESYTHPSVTFIGQSCSGCCSSILHANGQSHLKLICWQDHMV